MSDTNRALFEAWFRAGLGDPFWLNRDGDAYNDQGTESMWQAWQGASAALTFNIPDLTNIAARMSADLDARETQIAGLNSEIARLTHWRVAISDAEIDALLVKHGKGDDGFRAFARAILSAQADHIQDASKMVEAARDDGPDLTNTDIPEGDANGSTLDQLYAAFHREPCGDTLAAIGRAIQELQATQPDPRVDDLAALVRRLVHSLSKAAPDHDLPAKAVDYLQRKGLQGSPLRDDAVKRDDVAGDAKHWRELLEAVIREHPDDDGDGQAPGHCHDVPGIWDRGNGAKAGKPCAWCLAWNKANAAIAASKEKQS